MRHDSLHLVVFQSRDFPHVKRQLYYLGFLGIFARTSIATFLFLLFLLSFRARVRRVSVIHDSYLPVLTVIIKQQFFPQTLRTATTLDAFAITTFA